MAQKQTSKVDQIKMGFLLVFLAVCLLLIVIATVQAFTAEEASTTGGDLGVNVESLPTIPPPTATLEPGVTSSPRPTHQHQHEEHTNTGG